MLFLCYSSINKKSIESQFGEADYSYYFVLEAYLPLLKSVGEVVVVTAIDDEFEREYSQRENTVLLAFCPPHKLPKTNACPIVPVFAWEFSSIPNCALNDDESENWSHTLLNAGQAITHSSYAKNVVLKDMPSNFPIAVIPSPIWDTFEDLRQSSHLRLAIKSKDLAIDATFIDSNDYQIDARRITPASPMTPHQNTSSYKRRWQGENLELNLAKLDNKTTLIGFYNPEPWGVWSKFNSPWIMLPRDIYGSVTIKIVANGFGNNINKTINMRLGENVFQIALTENLTEYTFEANLTQSANLLCFDNIDITTKRKPEDPRTLGIGLSQISITGNEVPDTLSAERIVKNDIGLDKAPRLINVSGVVYTSVLNPNDSRKNWEDILTGFCLAFRDNNNATLILKMNYKDLTGYIDDVFALFRQLSPFKCRVLIIHGFLDTASYNSLIEISSFAVNSSRGEGQCLPLMEYMSSGVPALAPNNTAMGDYVSAANTFIIESSPEPIFWPHDPQQTIRTLWYRPSWESLYNCYLDSYEIATTNPVKYREMSEQAYKSLHSFCSTDILKQRLLDFTNTMAIT